MDQEITNPAGAYVTTSDHTTGRDDTGGELAYGKEKLRFRANAPVTKGQALKFVVPTTTVPLSVTPTAGSEVNGFAGIAESNAATGDLVSICVDGHTFGVVGTAATAGNAATFGAAGVLTNVTPSATTVAGTVVGTFLKTGTTGQLVPIWVQLV